MRGTTALVLLAALAAPGGWSTAAAGQEPQPGDLPSRDERQQALQLGAEGRLNEAYAVLRPWALAHPEDVEALAAAAFCALSLERLGEADELIAGLPESPPPFRLLRARSRLLHDDPDGAIAWLEPAAEEAQGSLALDILATLAEAHLLRGSSAAAVRLLDGRAATPGLALLLARARYQSGDLQGALAELGALAAAGATDGEPAPGHSLLHGRVLLLAGRPVEAVPLLERAVALSPLEKEPWMLLSQARTAAGDTEGAAAALARLEQLQAASRPNSVLDRTIERERNDPTGREVRRAWELLDEGRAGEALDLARAEAALAPEDPRPRAAAAAALLLLGRAAEAVEAVATLAPEPPPTPEEARRLRRLADELAAAGHAAAAETVRRRARAEPPG